LPFTVKSDLVLNEVFEGGEKCYSGRGLYEGAGFGSEYSVQEVHFVYHNISVVQKVYICIACNAYCEYAEYSNPARFGEGPTFLLSLQRMPNA